MSTQPTKNNFKRFRITDKIRRAYEERDKSLDNLDPENPVMPPEFWDGAIIGKYYRPVKTAISMRIDSNVLAWLKAKGNGYQTQINEILKERMIAERRERLTAERARK